MARAARLGHKMPGMASVYEHVTPEMQQRVLDALQDRWETSLLTLRSKEREELITLQPQLQQVINELEARQQARAGDNRKIIAQISPKQA